MRISDWSSDVCSSDLAGNSVVAGFFRQEINDAQRMFQRDALFLEGLRHFNAGEHAYDAVETSSAHHRVAMRAGNDGPGVGIASFAPADQVSGRIERAAQAGLFEFRSEGRRVGKEGVSTC